MASDLLERATRVLHQTYDIALTIERDADDVEAAGFDAVAEIRRGGNQTRAYVETRESLDTQTATKVANHWRAVGRSTASPRDLIVVAGRISTAGEHLLADRGVHYLNLSSGAIRLQFGDVLIDVRQGDKRLAPLPRTNKPSATEDTGGTSTQLFSTKRAQVTAALLAWPQLAALPVRRLAHSAGVSTGLAHDTVVLLQEQGHLTRDALVAPERLLREWGAAYPAGLGSALTVKTFDGDATTLTIPQSLQTEVTISGEWAVHEQMRHHPMTVSIYTTSPKYVPPLAMANRWERALGSAQRITVRRTFWDAPDGADAKQPGGATPPKVGQCAPWPLVYGDLLATGDARLREVAEGFASWHLKSGGHDSRA